MEKELNELEINTVSELLKISNKEKYFVLLCWKDYEQYRINCPNLYGKYFETLLWGNRIKNRGEVSVKLGNLKGDKWYEPFKIITAAKYLKLKPFW